MSDKTYEWMRLSLPRLAAAAVRVAMLGPCAKSKRGVVVVDPQTGEIHASGHNAQPAPFTCDGSEACRAACGKLCVHAEAMALRCAGRWLTTGAHLLHVKAVDGKAVPSGPPSCWQCSREILVAGISVIWLLHENGWRSYGATEFHRLTLEHCGLLVNQREV